MRYLGYFQFNFHHIFYHCVFLGHDFSLINHYFYKKTKLLRSFIGIYLSLGYEFVLQRIRDLAIMRL